MRRLSITFTSLAALACTPPAENAGEVVSTEGSDDDDAAADGSGDDAPSSGPGVEGSAELDAALIFPMIRSANGVVLAQHGDPVQPGATIVEMSTSFQALWSIDLPDAQVAQISALPGGGYVVAGSTGTLEAPVATAWRISCCGEVELERTFPASGGEASVMVAAVPHGSAIILAMSLVSAASEPNAMLMETDVDLVEQWAQPWFRVATGVTGPSGDAVLTYTSMGLTYVADVGPEGPAPGSSFDRPTALVGSGDGLLLVSSAVDQLDVTPYGETTGFGVEIPGLSTQDLALDRRDRIACAFTTSTAPDAPEMLRVVEIDDAGVVARDVTVAAIQFPFVETTAIAVGEDHAIWVATREMEPGEGAASYLQRIAPL